MAGRRGSADGLAHSSASAMTPNGQASGGGPVQGAAEYAGSARPCRPGIGAVAAIGRMVSLMAVNIGQLADVFSRAGAGR